MNTRGRVAVFQGVLTVAAEVSLLTSLQLLILQPSCRRVCGGGRRFHRKPHMYNAMEGSPRSPASASFPVQQMPCLDFLSQPFDPFRVRH